MEKDILYEKGRLKITYLHSPEPAEQSKVISTEDHELWIKDFNGEEWNRYIIQRGILRELAYTAKKKPISMSMLETINPTIWNGMVRGGVILEDLEKAFISAYQKEEEDLEKYLAEQKIEKD